MSIKTLFKANSLKRILNISRLMSEELFLNDKRVEKHLNPPGFEPLTSLFITICTADCAISPLLLLCCNQVYIKDQRVYNNCYELRSRPVKNNLK